MLVSEGWRGRRSEGEARARGGGGWVAGWRLQRHSWRRRGSRRMQGRGGHREWRRCGHGLLVLSLPTRAGRTGRHPGADCRLLGELVHRLLQLRSPRFLLSLQLLDLRRRLRSQRLEGSQIRVRQAGQRVEVARALIRHHTREAAQGDWTERTHSDAVSRGTRATPISCSRARPLGRH